MSAEVLVTSRENSAGPTRSMVLSRGSTLTANVRPPLLRDAGLGGNARRNVGHEQGRGGGRARPKVSNNLLNEWHVDRMKREIVPSSVEIRREQQDPALAAPIARAAPPPHRYISRRPANRPGVDLPDALERDLTQVRGNGCERLEDGMAQIGRGQHASRGTLARPQRRRPVEDGREDRGIEVVGGGNEQAAASVEKRTKRVANAAVDAVRGQQDDDRLIVELSAASCRRSLNHERSRTSKSGPSSPPAVQRARQIEPVAAPRGAVSRSARVAASAIAFTA